MKLPADVQQGDAIVKGNSKRKELGQAKVDPTTARDKTPGKQPGTPGKQPGCGMNFFSNMLGSNKSKDAASTANNTQSGTQSGGDSRYCCLTTAVYYNNKICISRKDNTHLFLVVGLMARSHLDTH